MKIIYSAIVGSRGYGVAEESSDTDIMGVGIEPIEDILGLRNFEQTITSDDTGQQTIYGLKKYLRLAIRGNPTINELLWAPTLVREDPYTAMLEGIKRELLSRRTLKSYFHYMDDQIARLKGERGQKNVNRIDLVEKFGYDTKYAYHIVRLGLMGQTIGQTGRIYMPVDDFHKEILIAIRRGEWSLEKVLETAERGKQGIEHWIHHSVLPERPDEGKIEEVLIAIYRRAYGLVHC